MPHTRDEEFPDGDEFRWEAPIRFSRRWEPPITHEEMAFVETRAKASRSRGEVPSCCLLGDIERHLPLKAAAFRAEDPAWHLHETPDEIQARSERIGAEIWGAIRAHNVEDAKKVAAWRAGRRQAQ